MIRKGRLVRALPVFAVVAAVALAAAEFQTSWLQSRLLPRLDRQLSCVVKGGASRQPPHRGQGPYDFRLGYARLPGFLEHLSRQGFRIVSQARCTTAMGERIDRFVYPVYREKSQAGLSLLDRKGVPLYEVRVPRHVYRDFPSIPPPVVATLLFVENRDMLDERYPYRNPAVDWPRFAKAMLDLGYSRIVPSHPVSGGSTLATQIEKFRHSPAGRTHDGVEKIRQMATASLRAYLDGERTHKSRRRIILDYVNAMPLAAMPGTGEIIGLGDGLAAWYGTDFDRVNQLLLEAPSADPHRLAEQGRAFRQVATLVLAVKKPSEYLTKARPALESRVDAYLRLLAKEEVVDRRLCRAALESDAGSSVPTVPPEGTADPARKAADAIRGRLLGLLDLNDTYDLDRLDLSVETTLDGELQRAVADTLARLGKPGLPLDPELQGPWLLDRGDPSGIIYSFTLFERTPGGNLLRVQADSLDQPLDINEGTKLELGSTAKLRTLIHYLEIVAALHADLAGLSPERLETRQVPPQDRLTRWAVDYLSGTGDRGLPAMLEAAMTRTYSSSPSETFFTGGGIQRFSNFDHRDDGKILTVREAFRKSVNLVFVRLMRDVVNYHVARLPGYAPSLFEDRGDPGRLALLSRFADMEGRRFLSRFYERYRGQSPDEMLETLVGGLGRPSPGRFAVIYRAVRPAAGIGPFTAFLRAHDPEGRLDDRAIVALYGDYDPGRLTLQDRSYLARIHPLELWLLEYRSRHPGAKFDELAAASADVRQEIYRWLFKDRYRRGQDHRIRTMLEADAFLEIHAAWKRMAFPFDRLVPSFATAIGSSGDNPAALAELMGILAGDGVRQSSVRIRALRFATGTPYSANVAAVPAPGERVLSPELAGMVKTELVGVVREGTARRISGVFARPDGTPIEVGGKTGTGDNRFKSYARGGRQIGSRVVNRTATFAFIIDDRFFGTVTAFVPGEKASGYGFTSALPVALLKRLAPILMPAVSSPPQAGT